MVEDIDKIEEIEMAAVRPSFRGLPYSRFAIIES